jgi:hypothetical protein
MLPHFLNIYIYFIFLAAIIGDLAKDTQDWNYC